MVQQTKVDVLGGRRVNVDGNTYAKLFLAQREDSGKDAYGVIPMTLTCEADVIDQLKGHELPNLNRPLPYFRGISRRFVHSSIFSRVGASGIVGAVQSGAASCPWALRGQSCAGTSATRRACGAPGIG